ncbi:MAG: carboxylesterase family protein [Anaerolineae bacterium]
MPGTQMIDGSIVTGTPEEILRSGQAHYVPIIIGSTAVDLPNISRPGSPTPIPISGDDAGAAHLYYSLPFLARAALVLKGQSRQRPASAGVDERGHDHAQAARFVAREMTAQGQPAWLYRFTYTAESTRPDSTQQAHAGELPFMFDTLDARYSDAVTDNDRQTARAFNTYVSNFVKTGNPNGGGLPMWQAFDGQYDLMDFSLENGPVYGRDPRAEGVGLVERVADAQSQ